MKVEGRVSLKSTFAKPCRKLLRIIFKFRIRKPFFIKALWVRRPRRAPKTINTASTPKTPKAPTFALRSLFGLLRRDQRKMDRVRELRSASEGVHEKEKLLFPSPITPPAFARRRKAAKGEVLDSGEEDVEDACRSFENYLVEMMIEEGKVRDLMDVEELLYCWKNLKCPVFVDLVCRFYGELCKDLFSPDNEVYTPNLQPSTN